MFVIKLSSDFFFKDSNKYKFKENYTEYAFFLSVALVWNGYHFACRKGNNSFINLYKAYHFRSKSGMCKGSIPLMNL